MNISIYQLQEGETSEQVHHIDCFYRFFNFIIFKYVIITVFLWRQIIITYLHRHHRLNFLIIGLFDVPMFSCHKIFAHLYFIILTVARSKFRINSRISILNYCSLSVSLSLCLFIAIHIKRSDGIADILKSKFCKIRLRVYIFHHLFYQL